MSEGTKKTAQKKRQADSTKKKRGPGKPKTIISDEDMAKAEEYAFRGCQNNTICSLMDWDHEWLHGRKDILRRLTKKRAERKLWLRQVQDKHAQSNPVMAIFLGKNYLGQADKQEHKLEVSNVADLVALGQISKKDKNG